ncbi:Amiloride-sensitive sodium channel, partial [Ancylostoma ceylanicum]
YASRGSIFESTSRLKKRASQIILEVPAEHLRRIKETEGVGSIRRESKHFAELNRTGDVSDDLLDYLMEFLIDASSLYWTADRENLHVGEKALEVYKAKHPNFTVEGFFLDAGFNCEESMMICSFGGRQFNCCQYMSVIITNLGKCFKLDMRNSGRDWMRKQMEAGVTAGLQIILDAHLEEQFDGTGDDADPIFADDFENGFRYYVHAPDTIPYLVSEGISVSPSTRVYSAISTSSMSTSTISQDAMNAKSNVIVSFIMLIIRMATDSATEHEKQLEETVSGFKWFRSRKYAGDMSNTKARIRALTSKVSFENDTDRISTSGRESEATERRSRFLSTNDGSYYNDNPDNRNSVVELKINLHDIENMRDGHMQIRADYRTKPRSSTAPPRPFFTLGAEEGKF